MAHEQGSDMSTGGSNRGVSKAFRVATALAVGALAASALVGCSGDVKPKAASGASGTTQAPTPTVVVPNPLTGMGTSPIGPVIAVKLDDTRPAGPRWVWTRPM